MALFSQSESAYLTSFLSAVDLDSSISPDGSVDPGVADRVPHLQGREALAKATMDLMALDVPVSSTSYHGPQPTHNHNPHGQPSAPTYWPSISTSESGTSLSSAALKFGTSGVRSSSPANYIARGLSSSISPPDASRSVPQLERPGSSSSSIFASHLPEQPYVQIAPLRGFDPPAASSSFTVPPISTTGLSNGVSTQESSARPSAVPSPASAPSVLSNLPSSSSSAFTKRPLPTSSQPATDPSAAKRLRRSPSSTPLSATSGAPNASPARSRRTASGTSKSTVPAAPPSASASGSKETDGSTSKGTLLSPSQKRANHIQSEQKRRLNIRRGYEALCEAVPALREAIRVEEERERVKEAEEYEESLGMGVNGKGKARGGGEKGKKRKGKGEGEKPDGRAGPRSENVVLQKTIDYITGLLAEQSALEQRLELARGMLPLGHPALPVDPQHLDTTGVPLWEREWDGGMDLDVGADAAGDGSEDEG